MIFVRVKCDDVYKALKQDLPYSKLSVNVSFHYYSLSILSVTLGSFLIVVTVTYLFCCCYGQWPINYLLNLIFYSFGLKNRVFYLYCHESHNAYASKCIAYVNVMIANSKIAFHATI